MFNLVNTGGPAVWLIFAVALSTLFLFVRRWYNLHSEQIGTRDFLTGITNVLQRGNMPEAISICEDTPGPVPQIVRAALLKADDNLQEIHTAIQQAGMVELPRLESKLGFFATVARIAPYLGLLGTVAGMMDQLLKLQAKAPLATPVDLSTGLHQALIATGAGLLLAILAHCGHQILQSRVSALVNDMETAGLAIFAHLHRQRESGERPRS